jgi:hypothetical protein
VVIGFLRGNFLSGEIHKIVLINFTRHLLTKNNLKRVKLYMVITLGQRTINLLYLVILLVDLFFIAILFYDLQNPSNQLEAIPRFLISKVDLKNESNLATWYSSTILFIAGCLAFLNLSINSYSNKLKWVYFAGWSLIGCLLLGLSADESAIIHESIAAMAYLDVTQTGRVNPHLGAGDWIPLLMPFMIASVILLLSFIIFSFFKCKKFMLLGLLGVFCWIGSIVGEAIEGRFINISMSRPLEGLIEESLEVIGTTLLLIAFAEHYQWRQKNNMQKTESAVPQSIALQEKPEIIG